ncbi:MAG: type I toxin-antitoxin system antitoxin YafN [Pseudoalteromonas marina]
MSTQQMLAATSVSASELRKNPCQYFQDQPVAVLNRSKAEGYMVSAAYFEAMVAALEKAYPEMQSGFRPALARLEAISHHCTELLLAADKEDLSEFTE